LRAGLRAEARAATARVAQRVRLPAPGDARLVHGPAVPGDLHVDGALLRAVVEVGPRRAAAAPDHPALLEVGGEHRLVALRLEEAVDGDDPAARAQRREARLARDEVALGAARATRLAADALRGGRARAARAAAARAAPAREPDAEGPAQLGGV